MKLNSPLPQPLPKECEKAAKIFKSFVDSGNNGLDGVIPRHILENAKGFAIFTIFKAGFLFSARAGSGVVIAKLSDGTWSAPSAIGTAGLGVGGQAGAEMTDFLVVLNSQSAIASFMAAGSLTLGGNMSIALGPLGRNGEASGSVNTKGKLAAMVSYSKSRGLFGGVSLEGSVIVERQDANAIAYGSSVTAKQLLSGSIDPPNWANTLIKTLETCTGLPGGMKWVDESSAQRGREGSYAFGGLGSPTVESPSSLSLASQRSKKGRKPSFPPASWSNNDSSSYFPTQKPSPPRTQQAPLVDPFVEPSHSSPTSFPSPRFETHFESDYRPDEKPQMKHPRLSFSSPNPSEGAYDFGSNTGPKFTNGAANSHSRSMSTKVPASSYSPPSKSHNRSFSHVPTTSSPDPFSSTGAANGVEYGYGDPEVDYIASPTMSSNAPKPYIAPKPELTRPLQAGEIARAVALYDFHAVESGDLSFSKGDVIIITKKSDSVDDWWRGKAQGTEGIFPANFVEVV
ncbi:hypothetical protein ONZ45_g10254 [Pleurotus djamor]|nr:hypothetical protein ONZ45_g10254 [Pleurotus djamor]